MSVQKIFKLIFLVVCCLLLFLLTGRKRETWHDYKKFDKTNSLFIYKQSNSIQQSCETLVNKMNFWKLFLFLGIVELF
jgi:hypothetical protein